MFMVNDILSLVLVLLGVGIFVIGNVIIHIEGMFIFNLILGILFVAAGLALYFYSRANAKTAQEDLPCMEEDTVTFLGEEYILPGELKIYTKYLQYFEEVCEQLVDLYVFYKKDVNLSQDEVTEKVLGGIHLLGKNALSEFQALDSHITKERIVERTQGYGALEDCHGVVLDDHEYESVIQEGIQNYCSELLNLMLSLYSKKHDFNISKIEEYDPIQSDDILKKATEKNRVKVLRDAFLRCPFNPNVYITMIELGCSEKQSLKTALFYHQEKNLLPELKEHQDDNKLLKSAYSYFTEQIRKHEK